MVASRFEVDVVLDARVPTLAPGAGLAADLFLPRAAGRVPAVVAVLPYRKDALGGAGLWAMLHGFAAEGIACVLADPRGLGSSDGRARPPFDPAEADDGLDLVRWAAAQPWCTGAVGLWGFSYGALIALRTASRRPPALKAVVSVMAMLDPERDFVHPGGAPGCFTASGMWGLSTLCNLVLPPIRDFHDGAAQRRWAERVAGAEPYLQDLYRHGPGDPAWRERAVDPRAITVPVLSVAGWRDMFCDAAVRTFEQAGGARKLVVGPWSHTVPDDATAHAIDLRALTMRWWRRWLAGELNGVDTEPAVTIFAQSRSAGWLDFDGWPPETDLAAPAGLVPALAAPDLESGMSDRSNGHPAGAPATIPPDPTVGPGSGLWGIPAASVEAPVDQHDDDIRAFAVTGRAAEEPVFIVGRPAVTVRLERPVERLVVKLTDVDGAGRSILITGGVLAPVGPGPQRVVLDPTCYVVAPGHSLRVVISESAFPRLWPTSTSAGVRLTGLELTLPVVPADAGKPTTLPGPTESGGAARWTEYRPLWEIQRVPTHGRVTVILGDRLSAGLPEGRAQMCAESRVAATAQRGSSAAWVDAASTAVVRLPTGEVVVTEVRLRLTRAVAHAVARVQVDGVTILDRRWHVTEDGLVDGGVAVAAAAHASVAKGAGE